MRKKGELIRIPRHDCQRMEQINTHAADDDDKRSPPPFSLSSFFSRHAFIHSFVLSSLIYRVPGWLTAGTIARTTIISAVFASAVVHAHRLLSVSLISISLFLSSQRARANERTREKFIRAIGTSAALRRAHACSSSAVALFTEEEEEMRDTLIC